MPPLLFLAAVKMVSYCIPASSCSFSHLVIHYGSPCKLNHANLTRFLYCHKTLHTVDMPHFIQPFLYFLEFSFFHFFGLVFSFYPTTNHARIKLSLYACAFFYQPDYQEVIPMGFQGQKIWVFYFKQILSDCFPKHWNNFHVLHQCVKASSSSPWHITSTGWQCT